MKIAAAALALLVVVLGGISVWVSRPLFDDRLDPAILDDVAVAPPHEALTFARAELDGRMRLLLVSQYRAGRVTAVDLNARLGSAETDPIRLYRELGYEALHAESASIANLIAVDAATLAVPFDAPAHNIGIGLNYAEHARESTLDEPPFVFPKIARPTPAFSEVSKNASTLLDYEAEIGFVTLEPVGTAAAQSATMGLVLANELTDRWALVRNLRRGGEMGTTGFADGKSREGFAPIGGLLVIPRDLETFYRKIEMRLYLNGRLRQHDSADAMIWGPRQMLAEIFGRAGWTFSRGDGTVPLLNAEDQLAPGTIIFSGTPGGVIFRPANLWNPWVYLRPGDEVAILADYLGVIRNRVID